MPGATPWKTEVAIKDMIQAGETDLAISRKVGLSRTTIFRIRKTPFEPPAKTKRKIPETGTVIGKKFNHWTVLRFTSQNRHGIYYLCKCDCGNERRVAIKQIISGRSRSCGCARSNGEMGSKMRKVALRVQYVERLSIETRTHAASIGATIFPDEFRTPKQIDSVCNRLNIGKDMERGEFSHSMQAVYARSRAFEHIGNTQYVKLNPVYQLKQLEQGYWTIQVRRTNGIHVD